jgi:REP element-mobilizing transposase RayT
MTQYRRDCTAGGTWFFTVNLAERRSNRLADEIHTLRAAFSSVRAKHPFDVNAIVVLPDHIHIDPRKHGCITRVRDWPWSSFHRHVREGLLPSDWGDAPDSGLDSS